MIDEGKAILLDKTDDDQVKARIANNLLLYNGLVNIRLKRIPNLEVYNNTIYTDPMRVSPIPSGIAGTSNIPELKLYNNLVMTRKDAIGIDISLQGKKQANHIYSNYIYGGKNRKDMSGIKRYKGVDYGDFTGLTFKPNDIPNEVGVDKKTLRHLKSLIEDYGIEVKSTNWKHNHLKNVEVIVNNVSLDFYNPRIGRSTINPNKQGLYYDVSDRWSKEFGYKIFQLVLPEEFVEAHRGDYPIVDPNTLDISGKTHYQGNKK